MLHVSCCTFVLLLSLQQQDGLCEEKWTGRTRLLNFGDGPNTGPGDPESPRIEKIQSAQHEEAESQRLCCHEQSALSNSAQSAQEKTLQVLIGIPSP